MFGAHGLRAAVSTGTGKDEIVGRGSEGDSLEEPLLPRVVPARSQGRSGARAVQASPPRSSLAAGPGNDVIYGGSGPDQINPGSGSDLVAGGRGQDRILAGAERQTTSNATAAATGWCWTASIFRRAAAGR